MKLMIGWCCHIRIPHTHVGQIARISGSLEPRIGRTCCCSSFSSGRTWTRRHVNWSWQPVCSHGHTIRSTTRLYSYYPMHSAISSFLRDWMPFSRIAGSYRCRTGSINRCMNIPGFGILALCNWLSSIRVYILASTLHTRMGHLQSTFYSWVPGTRCKWFSWWIYWDWHKDRTSWLWYGRLRI